MVTFALELYSVRGHKQLCCFLFIFILHSLEACKFFWPEQSFVVGLLEQPLYLWFVKEAVVFERSVLPNFLVFSLFIPFAAFSPFVLGVDLISEVLEPCL